MVFVCVYQPCQRKALCLPSPLYRYERERARAGARERERERGRGREREGARARERESERESKKSQKRVMWVGGVRELGGGSIEQQSGGEERRGGLNLLNPTWREGVRGKLEAGNNTLICYKLLNSSKVVVIKRMSVITVISWPSSIVICRGINHCLPCFVNWSG